MNSNLSITGGVYGILSETDVREQRAAMGQNIKPGETIDNETLVPLLEQLLAELKQKKHNSKISCAF
jgi:hypothetical protein